jgi:Ca-activated chloride channel homolog
MKNTLLLVIALIVSMQIQSQEKKITGTVSDNSGYPLPGVNIVIKKTTTGTQTDFEGHYEITTNVGDVLTYTYVGLKAVEVIIGTSNIINVTMEEDIALLSEVVIAAHGIKRVKKSLGYAVSDVIAVELERRTEGDVARVLSGKASGVKISSQNGTSGSATNVVIRGYNSISGNQQPLYVIDGVSYSYEKLKNENINLTNLDSKNIDNVNVLKGLSAASLYGTAGRNGVFVITTKNGNFKSSMTTITNEVYKEIIENDFENVLSSPLSTFSIDVDKASYSNIRRMINNAQSIPSDAVKIEEMVNYFEYEYDQPQYDHPFAINTELIETPWNSETKFVKIGLQGKSYNNEEFPASNLTFLIDVSGSMNSQNKLPLLKSAFRLLVNQLRKEDNVSIVVYAGAAGVVLEPTSGSNKDIILGALDNMQAGGSTAGGAGIELAYKLA